MPIRSPLRAVPYVLVTLENGQTLTGRAGTEVLMRSGAAAVTQSAAVDLTFRLDGCRRQKAHGNHLVSLQADGAGVRASDDTTVMVRGSYSIG